MRPKRDYRRFEYDAVLDILRSYHRDGKTQTELAEVYGVNSGHINKIVHGQFYREAYAQVAAELANSVELPVATADQDGDV